MRYLILQPVQSRDEWRTLSHGKNPARHTTSAGLAALTAESQEATKPPPLT